MNVSLKLTLDSLIQALRWRQIEYLDNPNKSQGLGTKRTLDRSLEPPIEEQAKDDE